MINLHSILKSREVTLPTKVRLVKAMVFPVVVYECEESKMVGGANWCLESNPFSQRPPESSNKSCAHQDPGTPQKLRQNCVPPVEVRTGWQWSAAEIGALGVGMA